MDNWLVKASSIVIVIISYVDTIISAVSYTNPFSILLVFAYLSILIKAGQGWRAKANKQKIKWSFTDLIATILFFFRFNDKYATTVQIVPRAEASIWSPIIGWIGNNSLFAIYILLTLAVLNSVLSRYGWGVTRLFKACLYQINYMLIYWLMNTKACAIVKLFLEKKYKLSKQEIDLFRLAATWRKNQLRDNKTNHLSFPIVLRKHAEKRSFLVNWLYNISLVPGNYIKLIHENNNVNSRNMKLEVDLSDSRLAIINNDGKRFLKQFYKNDAKQKKKLARANSEINNFLGPRDKMGKKELKFCPDSFYRWGSAGALPIIKWKGEKWIAFVYRDIYPMGWNLPLGASECELEKGRPGITAIREMLEEIIVVQAPLSEYVESDVTEKAKRRELYHPLLNSISGEINYRASERNFYKKQKDIIDQTCAFEFDEKKSGPNAISCADHRTSLEIKVVDENRDYVLPENLSTNCLTVVDSFEQGIECIKPVYFEIEDENELRFGEVDFTKDMWINNPVILIKYDALEGFFSNPIPFVNKDHESFGEGMLIDFLQEDKNYHLFGVQKQDRLNYIIKLKEKTKDPTIITKKVKRIKTQINYLSDFVNRSGKYFESDEKLASAKSIPLKDNPAYHLCPAAWKACYYLFQNLYNNTDTTSLGE